MSHVSPWDVARDVADVASDAGDLNREIRDLAHKTFRKWGQALLPVPGLYGTAAPCRFTWAAVGTAGSLLPTGVRHGSAVPYDSPRT